jgi:catechol 2,3-dioxygenase-like lactoylglutathione lyase family enzyme
MVTAMVSAVRVARHTERLEEVVAFYRDGLGLVEIGAFRDHDGYDGVFLDIPGTGAHLEFTAGGGEGVPTPHPESLLVLYLGDEAAVSEAVARLAADPVPAANPCWARHGVTVLDPDGFRVVLVGERWDAERLGFRMRAVERDAFTPATGYEPGLRIDGIELRDRVWLDLPLDRAR